MRESHFWPGWKDTNHSTASITIIVLCTSSSGWLRKITGEIRRGSWFRTDIFGVVFPTTHSHSADNHKQIFSTLFLCIFMRKTLKINFSWRRLKPKSKLSFCPSPKNEFETLSTDLTFCFGYIIFFSCFNNSYFSQFPRDERKALMKAKENFMEFYLHLK